MASNGRMIGECHIVKDVEGSGRGLILRRYPVICLDGLGKITKTLNQDSMSPCRDLNPEHPEYETGALTTRP
jgi:hypothetical protein